MSASGQKQELNSTESNLFVALLQDFETAKESLQNRSTVKNGLDQLMAVLLQADITAREDGTCPLREHFLKALRMDIHKNPKDYSYFIALRNLLDKNPDSEVLTGLKLAKEQGLLIKTILLPKLLSVINKEKEQKEAQSATFFAAEAKRGLTTTVSAQRGPATQSAPEEKKRSGPAATSPLSATTLNGSQKENIEGVLTYFLGYAIKDKDKVTDAEVNNTLAGLDLVYELVAGKSSQDMIGGKRLNLSSAQNDLLNDTGLSELADYLLQILNHPFPQCRTSGEKNAVPTEAVASGEEAPNDGIVAGTVYYWASGNLQAKGSIRGSEPEGLLSLTARASGHNCRFGSILSVGAGDIPLDDEVLVVIDTVNRLAFYKGKGLDSEKGVEFAEGSPAKMVEITLAPEEWKLLEGIRKAQPKIPKTEDSAQLITVTEQNAPILEKVVKQTKGDRATLCLPPTKATLGAYLKEYVGGWVREEQEKLRKLGQPTMGATPST